MAPNMGRGAQRREEYLDLRRDGMTHEEACREMDIYLFDSRAKQFERWFMLETGQGVPVRPKPFGAARAGRYGR
jgi:hypothetical protein